MKIKRIKQLKVNSCVFNIFWDKKTHGANFTYGEREINIGIRSGDNNIIFMLICHEIMEICATEMGVRLDRPDCLTDYIFVYDHRQHTTMMEMFAGLISEFIQ